MRLSAEEEKRIRNESSTMIYRGDHDAAFAYKADIAALFAELDAVRAIVEAEEKRK
jgi:hypothetical protein